MSECCCWLNIVVQLRKIVFFFLKLWKTINIMEVTTENDSFIYLFTWKVRQIRVKRIRDCSALSGL